MDTLIVVVVVLVVSVLSGCTSETAPPCQEPVCYHTYPAPWDGGVVTDGGAQDGPD